MPRMWVASPCADVGCVRFAHAEGCAYLRFRDASQRRLNCFQVYIRCEPRGKVRALPILHSLLVQSHSSRSLGKVCRFSVGTLLGKASLTPARPRSVSKGMGEAYPRRLLAVSPKRKSRSPSPAPVDCEMASDSALCSLCQSDQATAGRCEDPLPPTGSRSRT